ncbi:MAG: GIY-YIG nuclease family protein [bacterium]
MFYVYILQSQASRKYYVGSTQDVRNRLREHNHGESLSTRGGIPSNSIISLQIQA